MCWELQFFRSAVEFASAGEGKLSSHLCVTEAHVKRTTTTKINAAFGCKKWVSGLYSTAALQSCDAQNASRSVTDRAYTGCFLQSSCRTGWSTGQEGKARFLPPSGSPSLRCQLRCVLVTHLVLHYRSRLFTSLA